MLLEVKAQPQMGPMPVDNLTSVYAVLCTKALIIFKIAMTTRVFSFQHYLLVSI